MVSFAELFYVMEDDSEDQAQDSMAMRAIRNGLNIREDFWDDFMQVTNNADALSDLLNISSEKISSWSALIKKNLEKVRNADANGEGEEKPKTKVLDTGELGGISVNNPLGV